MSNEELKAVAQEAIQAGLFGDCEDSNLDNLPFMTCSNCPYYDEDTNDCDFDECPWNEVDESEGQQHIDDSFKCKDEDRDFCLFDCGRCQCVGTSNAPPYCPERGKVKEQKVIHTELNVDCSEPCQDCKCYDSFFDECVCVNYKDVPPSCPQYEILAGQLHLGD